MPHGTRREQCASNDPSSHPNRSTCLLEHPVGLPASTLDATPKDTPKVAIRSILPPTQSIPQTRRPIRPQDPADPPADVDWKKESRKHEAEAKKNRAAAAELEKIKASKRTAEEKAAKEAADAKADAEAARAEAARERAARKYGLSDEDLDFLEGVPADKFDAKAKALSERIKAAAPAGKSGLPAGGAKEKTKSTTLSGSIAAHYS